jgi:shikimate kinase
MTNLFLIGYRGTGKTVLGRMVSIRLKKEFVDTDSLIVELSGKSIPQLFKEDGEEKFREWETKALTKACEKDNCIISCGGGIITQDRNFVLLKTGVVCLLTAGAKIIYDRIYKDSNRPALTDKDPFEEIVHVLKVREPLYQKAKDFEVLTSLTGQHDCVKEIITKYNNQIKEA